MLIKTTNVNKFFDNNIQALKNINLEVEKGEFLTILGPSGCGKTTLLNVLGTIESPSAGEVFLLNNKINDLSFSKIAKLRREDIAFVFQFFNLIEHLTVKENILIASILNKKDKKEKLETLLQQLDLKKHENFYPSQLSGGLKGKVAIARALINEPKVIFADEPTGNLNSSQSIQIMEILKQLNKSKNITVVLVTHNEALTTCGTRVIKMFDGSIIYDSKSVI